MIKEMLGNGHVHDTYLIKNDDGNPAYILQRINTVAFQHPQELVSNIQKVSNYIRKKGGKSLELLPFEDGSFLQENADSVWRKMKYIESVSVDETDDISLIERIAFTFGDFAAKLSDFDEELFETIPDFHNTPKRVQDCLTAAENCNSSRKDAAKELIALVEKSFSSVCYDYNLLLSCAPMRITHNDTKINNVLLDKNTHEPICVIDLDTVMKGMTLYDFGDAARSVALDFVPSKGLVFNQKKYEAFEKGFTNAANAILTNDEKKNLWLATKTITTELGCRFLEDYLRNDIYFRTKYSDENLKRAENLLLFTMNF